MLDLKELPLKKDKKPYRYGSIYQTSKNCYSIRMGNKYYCSCRTFEQAYYVRRELYKCGWDKSELPRIFDEYPVFYTDLIEFYRYITNYKKSSFLNWILTIPSKKSDNGIAQHIRYSKLEDALFERDFLFENDWDYELLVEQINDVENPYYDYMLPPYPQRKVRNIRVKNNHQKELLVVIGMIQENSGVSQESVCEVLGITDITLRNWMYDYGTTWQDFKELVFNGVNPFDVLVLKRHIYTPDLSLYNDCEHIYRDKHNNRNPYFIQRCGVRYGVYPTKNVARKVVTALKKCDWDKSMLPKIQGKFGVKPVSWREQNIYRKKDTGNFYIRKTVDGKSRTYGTYTDYDFACLVRDLLHYNDWDYNLKEELELYARRILSSCESFKCNMFNGGGVVL